jgi:hypothetical protein
VDAPAFDLADHVRVVPLPDPGDEAALLLATEQLRLRRLDRSRPLWEMCFLPGLPENRVGMFVKMHHAIADGISGVATLAALLDAAPDVPTGPAPPRSPAPPPAARDLFADNLRRHTASLRSSPALGWGLRARRRPRWRTNRSAIGTNHALSVDDPGDALTACPAVGPT